MFVLLVLAVTVTTSEVVKQQKVNFYHPEPLNIGKRENYAFKMLLLKICKAELKFGFLPKCKASAPELTAEAKQQYAKQCHFQACLAAHT